MKVMNNPDSGKNSRHNSKESIETDKEVNYFGQQKYSVGEIKFKKNKNIITIRKNLSKKTAPLTKSLAMKKGLIPL